MVLFEQMLVICVFASSDTGKKIKKFFFNELILVTGDFCLSRYWSLAFLFEVVLVTCVFV